MDPPPLGAGSAPGERKPPSRTPTQKALRLLLVLGYLLGLVIVVKSVGKILDMP